MLCARFLLELPPERHFLHLKQGVFMWESLQNSYFSMQKQGVFMLFFMEELSSSARERLAGAPGKFVRFHRFTSRGARNPPLGHQRGFRW